MNAYRVAADDVAADLAVREGLAKLLTKHPRLSCAIGLVVVMTIVALSAPMLAPYDPLKTNPDHPLQAPSLSHPLGTDNLGRDTLSRVLFGGRISFGVALLAIAVSATVGVSAGMAAGYVGGAVDQTLSRLVDAQIAFPGVLLAIAIASALGPSLQNAMLGVGVLGIPVYFRLTRGQVLQAREFEYVAAARAMGATPLRIVVRHVLPNILSPLIVVTSVAASRAIVALASLSFIGIGSQPPTADWGSMIYNGAGYLNHQPWLLLGPGAAIFVTVLALYWLGDALRDALDPRSRTPRAI